VGTRGRPPTPDILTPREWEVLALIREGLSNREIAARLGINLSGAKHHVSEIITKLAVSTREEAAAWRPARGRLLALPMPLAGLLPRPPKSAPVKALAAAALSGVALLAIVAFALALGGFRGGAPGGGATGELQAQVEEARRHALEVAPDAVLRQVDIHPSLDTPMFRFVSTSASQEIDVSPPAPDSPLGLWEVARLDSSPLVSSSSQALDLRSLRVGWREAVDAAKKRWTDCMPSSVTLTDQGDTPGWYVYCELPGGNLPLFAMDARTGESLSPSTSPVQPPLDTAPDWSLAQFVSREGRLLSVRLDATDEVILVDLAQLAVFDCRVDCFSSSGTLGPVSTADKLCIGWLGIRGGHQSGKLWVNRYTCYAGGRVIPP
jgi:DNA-binding CsgD family transcriptional regulator